MLKAVVFGCAALGLVACSREEEARLQHGKDLFTGNVALQGRMTGHDEELPPEALRCANCHVLGQPKPASSAAAGSGPRDQLGPVLNRASLTSSLQRRGGPPSSYDQAAFCGLLRTGIDPAHVMVPQTMPRYTITDKECGSLWLYLTAP